YNLMVELKIFWKKFFTSIVKFLCGRNNNGCKEFKLPANSLSFASNNNGSIATPNFFSANLINDCKFCFGLSLK
ncbi:MAG: hypothetical protein ABIC82_05020, partial [bacterium]